MTKDRHIDIQQFQKRADADSAENQKKAMIAVSLTLIPGGVSILIVHYENDAKFYLDGLD